MTDRFLGLESDVYFEGQPAFDRMYATSLTGVFPSGTQQFTFFTASQTRRIQSIATDIGTAAVATPTLCRLGLYEVTLTQGVNLLAATANDPNLFSVGSSSPRRDLNVPVVIERGRRYAAALLLVSAAAGPTILRAISGGQTSLRLPRTTGNITGVTDLVQSAANADIGLATSVLFFDLFTRLVAEGVSELESQ